MIEQRAVRPTLRCLRDDLHLKLPPLTTPLDEINHPLLNKARTMFVDTNVKPERIRSIDDRALFKAKIQRWRGAVWIDGDVPWLIAAGQRQEGSLQDFYASLTASARAARARDNAGSGSSSASTDVRHLLPGREDHLRLQAESSVRFIRRLRRTVIDLVTTSLCDGREHCAEFDTFIIGVQVRADDGHETYVAIRIMGPVPENLTPVLLRNVPGCEPDGWYPEYTLPERDLMPAEQAWSNLMDPCAAATLLNNRDA